MAGWFEWLFASGHAVDIVVAVLLVELGVLLWRGWPLTRAISMLAPAALILLGTRAALVGADWPWIAGPILLSLPVHIYDVRLRERQARRG